jgi:hypothetical protein
MGALFDTLVLIALFVGVGGIRVILSERLHSEFERRRSRVGTKLGFELGRVRVERAENARQVRVCVGVDRFW